MAASNLENLMTHSEKASGGKDSPAKFAARVYKFKIMLIKSGKRELSLSSETSWFELLDGVDTSATLFDGVWCGEDEPPSLSDIG
jgi:hypothetical protein